MVNADFKEEFVEAKNFSNIVKDYDGSKKRYCCIHNLVLPVGSSNSVVIIEEVSNKEISFNLEKLSLSIEDKVILDREITGEGMNIVIVSLPIFLIFEEYLLEYMDTNDVKKHKNIMSQVIKKMILAKRINMLKEIDFKLSDEVIIQIIELLC